MTHLKQYMVYSSCFCKEKQYVIDALAKASLDLNRANKAVLTAIKDLCEAQSQIQAKQAELGRALSQT